MSSCAVIVAAVSDTTFSLAIAAWVLCHILCVFDSTSWASSV